MGAGVGFKVTAGIGVATCCGVAANVKGGSISNGAEGAHRVQSTTTLAKHRINKTDSARTHVPVEPGLWEIFSKGLPHSGQTKFFVMTLIRSFL
jgi:hypothetical protein